MIENCILYLVSFLRFKPVSCTLTKIETCILTKIETFILYPAMIKTWILYPELDLNLHP